MSTFKERMQPVIDGLPAGEDKDTLVALIDTHDSMEQAGFKPGSSSRAMRQYLRQAGGQGAAGHANRPPGDRPGRLSGNRHKPR